HAELALNGKGNGLGAPIGPYAGRPSTVLHLVDPPLRPPLACAEPPLAELAEPPLAEPPLAELPLAKPPLAEPPLSEPEPPAALPEEAIVEPPQLHASASSGTTRAHPVSLPMHGL